MQWEKVTDISLITSLIVLFVFAGLGAYQWFTRKSFKKVDRPLLAMLIPLVLMAIVYIVFDKLIVLNTRPNGSGESSFPSTHTMIVATIFFMVMIVLPRYVKSKFLRVLLDFVMLMLISLTAAGRVFANMHYITDVIGGLGFAIFFAIIYYFLTKEEDTTDE